MSVYVSQRSDPKPEFLLVAQELLVFTIKNVSKFPKSYRYPLTNDVLKLANEIHEYVLKANAIYIHRGMLEQDFLLRERYFTMARSSLVALSGKLTVAFNIVNEGNNFLETKQDYSKMFQTWIDFVSREQHLLKGMVESDKKRWRKYQNNEESETDEE